MSRDSNGQYGDPKKPISVNPQCVQNPNEAHVFELLYRHELKHACELIKGILEDINRREECIKDGDSNNQQPAACRDDFFDQHQHNTITVVGRRGVGKTTFILTLRRYIEGGNCTRDSKSPDHGNYGNQCIPHCREVLCLPPLDPSRMEDAETFLVTVVANILKEIQRRRRTFELPESVRKALSLLGSELVVLAPRQVHEEQWKDLMTDPDSFAFDVLSKAHSGLNLASRFHEFVKECLCCLGAEAFLQPIDDIDTAFVRAWPVLETVRRYLATPYVITVVSGDIDLYELAVRRHHLESISTLIESKKRLGEDLERLGTSVHRLSSQYLAKVMPCHLRIRVKPAAERIIDTAKRENRDYIKVKYGKNDEHKFSLVFSCFCEYFFGTPIKNHSDGTPKNNNPNESPTNNHSNGECGVFKGRLAHFLPRTTRNFARLLKLLEPWGRKENMTNEIEKRKRIDGIIQLYQSVLYNTDVWPDDLRALKRGDHIEWLAAYCLDHEPRARAIWRLQALYDDEDWNQIALLLQGFLFLSWTDRKNKNKAADNSGTTEGTEPSKDEKGPLLHAQGPISYMIKVLLPCWTAETHLLFGDKEGIKNLKRWLQIPNTERHRYMPVRNQVYVLWRAQGGMTGKNSGTKEPRHVGERRPARGPGYMEIVSKWKGQESVVQYILESNKQGEKDPCVGRWESIPACKFRIENEGNELEEIHPPLSQQEFDSCVSDDARFILNWFGHTLHQPGRDPLFSVNVLGGLARLADVLKEWPFPDDGKHGEEAGAEKNSDKLLKKNILKIFAQIPIWSVQRDFGDVVYTGLAIKQYPIPRASDPNSWVDILDTWVSIMRNLSDSDLLPPPIIAQTWVRFMGNLEAIGDLPISYWCVGAILERWIAAFFNAILIEEVIHRAGIEGVPEGLKIEYVVEDTSVLTGNLEAIWKDTSNKNSLAEHGQGKTLIPYTMAWMGCPLLLAPLEPSIRDSICNSSSFWTGLREVCSVCKRKVGDNRSVDIHDALCGLIAAGLEKGTNKQGQ